MKIVQAGILGVLSAGLVCAAGCNSSGTGSSAPDKSDIYVSTDGTTGTISLILKDSEFGVGETAGFAVSVKRSDGASVSGARISCDSEAGLSILEPTTGSELTDSWGGMSGVIGCAKKGSFQLGCRLPIGVNKRQLVSVHCVGEAPADFTGWPGAAGGGLGGGVVDDPTTSGDVRIVGVTFYDQGSTTDSTTTVDTSQDGCQESEDAEVTAEPFFDTLVGITVRNNRKSAIRLLSYRYEVDGASYDSLAFSGSVEVPASETSSEVFALFAEATDGGKQFYGAGSAIGNIGFTNVRFIVTVEDVSTGEEVEIDATAAASFQNYNNC